MSAEVNLLPVEKKAKPQILKISRVLKKVLTVFSVLFLITLCGFITAYFIFSRRLNTASQKQTKTKQQIVALEQTEQRLFLLKDRLSKIEKVEGKESAYEEIEILDYINSILDDRTSFSKAQLQGDKAVVTVEVADSLQLAKFIRNLAEKGDFKEVSLSSLDLDPMKFYKAEFTLKR